MPLLPAARDVGTETLAGHFFLPTFKVARAPYVQGGGPQAIVPIAPVPDLPNVTGPLAGFEAAGTLGGAAAAGERTDGADGGGDAAVGCQLGWLPRLTALARPAPLGAIVKMPFSDGSPCLK